MWVTTPCVRSCFPSDHDPGLSPSNSVDAQDTMSPSLIRRELPPFVFFLRWPPVVSGWMGPFSQARNRSLASSSPSKIGALTPGVSVPPRKVLTANSRSFMPSRTGIPTSGFVPSPRPLIPTSVLPVQAWPKVAEGAVEVLFRRDNLSPGCSGAGWYSIMLTFLVVPGMNLFAGCSLVVRAVRLCGSMDLGGRESAPLLRGNRSSQ